MLYEDMKSRSTATSKWSYVHFLLTRFNEFLKEVLNLWETMWYTSDYWHWWISLVTKKYIAEIYTWNTSLLCAGAVGIIQRSLKFCQSLRMWMTFRIILNWHKGIHFVIAVPLIWWHWHFSPQLDVMIDWLAENAWLSYWHKPARTELTKLDKVAYLKEHQIFHGYFDQRILTLVVIFEKERWLYLKSPFKIVCAFFSRSQYHCYCRDIFLYLIWIKTFFKIRKKFFAFKALVLCNISIKI